MSTLPYCTVNTMTLEEEDQLIDRLSLGDTAQEIADYMNTSVRTVNFRLQILYAKHNVPPGKHRNIKLLRAVGIINKEARL
jgi:DNA-binding NarL/FixJ family response regulator